MRPATIEQRRRLYLLARVVIARHYRRPLTLRRSRGRSPARRVKLTRATPSSARSPSARICYAPPERRRATVDRAAGDLGARRRQAGRLSPGAPFRQGVSQALRADARRLSRRGRAFARGLRKRSVTRRLRRTGRPSGCGAHPVRASRATRCRASAATRPAPLPVGAGASACRLPGADSALTRPPCCSATWRTIARPRPEPGRPRASAPR